MTDHALIQRSSGHLCFTSDGSTEYFQWVGGVVYRAPTVIPVMPDGRRSGRFFCEAAAWPRAAALYDLPVGLGFRPPGTPTPPLGRREQLLRLVVVRGCRDRRIARGQALVAWATPLGSDYGHRVQVTFEAGGAAVRLFARSVGTLARPEFNLCDGGGQAIVRVAPAPAE